MNTVQNIPLWTVILVTPLLFLLFVSSCCVVKFFLCTAQPPRPQTIRETGGAAAQHGNSLNKRAVAHYREELKKQNKNNKQKETNLDETLCYSWEKKSELVNLHN